MGWEVFYQVTLIPTPIYSTELTSKREGKSNVMITGFINLGLHMILSRQLNPRPTCDWSTSSFNLHHFCYELFFTPSHCCYNLNSLIPTRPPISTSSFWSRSPMHSRLLVDQCFSGSGCGGAKRVSSCSIKKSH